MNIRRSFIWLFSGILALAGSSPRAAAASGLNVVFGAAGVSRLSYGNTVLFDESSPPADNLRIVDYTLVTSGKSVHFRDNFHLVSSWDARARTLTRSLDWGTIATRYDVRPNALEMTITVTNATSNSTLNGLTIFPLEVRFPTEPADLKSGVQTAPCQPGVTIADFGAGALAYVVEDVARPAFYGLLRDDNTARFKNFTAWIGTSQLPWGLDAPQCVFPIAPKTTVDFHVSLRFGPSGSTAVTIAPDVLAAFAAAFPFNVDWPDRRPIGRMFIAARGPKSNSATNPPGWFNNPRINVLTDAGKADFARQLVASAKRNIPTFRATHAQGMILWDVEGEQYPESYIGDPRVATQLSPELNYDGAIDKYFEAFRLAGFRVGVTIRPQKLIFKDGVPVDQQDLTDAAETADLLADKIGYAREHWGCSIFYIDSTGPGEDPAIFRRVHQQYPDVLLIPENPNVGMYSVCAPLGSILQNRIKTPDLVRAVYPNAFSVTDPDPEKTITKMADLVDGVRHGDILLFFGPGPNALVPRAYREAAAR